MAENINENKFTTREDVDEVIHFSLKSILSGEILETKLVRKNMGFIGLLIFLGLVYIYSGYHTEGLYTEKDSLENEVKELRFESVTTSSQLMKLSLQSEVKKQIEREGLNLVESKEPPVKIYK